MDNISPDELTAIAEKPQVEFAIRELVARLTQRTARRIRSSSGMTKPWWHFRDYTIPNTIEAMAHDMGEGSSVCAAARPGADPAEAALADRCGCFFRSGVLGFPIFSGNIVTGSSDEVSELRTCPPAVN